MRRLYESIVEQHFGDCREALFLSGPRQVGKTTLAQALESHYSHYTYLNWDNPADRLRITQHDIPALHANYATAPLVILDEIHKSPNWKNHMKGLLDSYMQKVNFVVTGSARLDTYRRGGDSMMGRYFLYRVHPLSTRELLDQSLPQSEFSLPKKIEDDIFAQLLEFGGFPRPFLAAEKRFYNRWVNGRLERLLTEDIRDLLRSHELSKLELLAYLLRSQCGSQVNYTSLAKKIQASDPTIRSWINVLESLFYCFTIKPWSTNVSRSLLKDPKIYLWDWSMAETIGQRNENFIASHLLKAVHFWTDCGLGSYKLHYLRDKDKKEVDFLITRNHQPFIMIEVKTSGKEGFSPALLHFQKQVQAKHVFQVAMDLPFAEIDCFAQNQPIIVPAKTLLSQLV